MSASCTACGAELRSALVCESCDALQAAPDELSPFDALGIEPAAELEAGLVRKRLLRLSRLTHPDFFSGADDETRARAEAASAALNAAQRTLDDPIRRCDWIVKSLGGPSESEERQMPQAFLMEVLEWNETLEDARAAAPGSPERGALDALESGLASERETLRAQLALGLTPLPEANAPALAELRRRLNAVRYIDRTLAEIRELRLADASSTR